MMRHRFHKRPRIVKDGDVAFVAHKFLISKQDEIALTLALITHRRLFGEFYLQMHFDYFFRMPIDSGVFVCPFAVTKEIMENATNPSDIDLLIIPYEGNELVLENALDVEIKVVRAKFSNQGKSPNEFGLSQAGHLLGLGFPYVAVAHLIVSDVSPQNSWRETGVCQVVSERGDVEMRSNLVVDMMPSDLIKRAYGKLTKLAHDPRVGIASIYLGTYETLTTSSYHDAGIWLPFCRGPERNTEISSALLQNIGTYFDENPNRFLDNPRHDESPVNLL